MLRRKPGETWSEISAIGIGAMSFSDFYGPTDTQESHKILKAAMELGIDHIDSANVYGMGLSEKRIGSFLKLLSKQDKDFFKIATKGGIDGTPGAPKRCNNDPEYLTTELDNSLKRLGVDNIDLYYIHRRDPEWPIEVVVETLIKFKAAGKINQFGFSEISPTSLQKAANLHPVGAVQSEYSLGTRYPELGLIQKTAKLKTALVAFSPVGRSLLTDNPHSEQKVKSLSFLEDNPRFQEPNLSANIKATEGFRNLARDLGVSAAGLALAWLLEQGPHIIPIPGTRSVDRLKEMVKGVNLKLSPSDLIAISDCLPLGWAHGDRYSLKQWDGPEKYC